MIIIYQKCNNKIINQLTQPTTPLTWRAGAADSLPPRRWPAVGWSPAVASDGATVTWEAIKKNVNLKK